MDIIVVKNQSYKKHDWIAKPKSDTFSILQRAKKDLRQGYSLHSNVKCNYKKYWVYQRSMTILTQWLGFQTLIRIFLHPPLQWKLLRHQDSLPLLDITNPVLLHILCRKISGSPILHLQLSSYTSKNLTNSPHLVKIKVSWTKLYNLEANLCWAELVTSPDLMH